MFCINSEHRGSLDSATKDTQASGLQSCFRKWEGAWDETAQSKGTGFKGASRHNVSYCNILKLFLACTVVLDHVTYELSDPKPECTPELACLPMRSLIFCSHYFLFSIGTYLWCMLPTFTVGHWCTHTWPPVPGPYPPARLPPWVLS